MSISDINKKKEKIIQSTKSISYSTISNNIFSSQNSKIIKIKTISKHTSIKNKQDLYKNMNRINSPKNNESDKDNEDNDDFDFILKERIKDKENNKKKNLIIQRQMNINIKNMNKNNIEKRDALINQHIESIQLNFYLDDLNLNENNRIILRKKLNLNLNTKKNVINIVKIAPIINLDFSNQEMHNQFINNNIANFNMLEKINFFSR